MPLRVQFLREKGVSNVLASNGYSLQQEGEIYDSQLDDIIHNARLYLDSLEHMIEYRVSWVGYSKKKSPTLPLKFVKIKRFKKDSLPVC